MANGNQNPHNESCFLEIIYIIATQCCLNGFIPAKKQRSRSFVHLRSCRGDAHGNKRVMQEASGGGGAGTRGGDPCHRGVAVLGTDPGNARPTRSRDFPTETPLVAHPPAPLPASAPALRVEPLIFRGAAPCTRAHICTSARAQIRQARRGIWAKFKSHLSCLESFRERKLQAGAKC